MAGVNKLMGVEGANQKFKRAFAWPHPEIRAAREVDWKATSKDVALHCMEIASA